MDTALIWTLAFILLNTGLVLPLLRRKPVLVPLTEPIIFLTGEIATLQWLFQGSWSAGARFTALACFVFAGCVLLQQSFGRRRWFIFRGGGFIRDMDTYDALAQVLAEARADLHLPPATIICRYDGWLGLSPLLPEEEAGIMSHIEDALADTRWARWGIWQAFFAIQWAVIVLALLRQLIESHGGF